MQESKYVQLVQTLSKSERIAFKKYLYNFYENRQKAIAIYTYVDKFKKDKFKHPKLEDAYVRGKVFNTPTYEGKGLSNPLSALNLYLEEFLRWQKIRYSADTYEKNKMQLDIYRERKLDKAFFQEALALKERIRAAPLDMWRHLKMAEVESSIHYNPSSLKLTKKKIALPAFRYHINRFCEDVLMKTSCEKSQRLEMLDQDVEYTTESQHYFFDAYQLIKRLIDSKDEKSFVIAKNFALEKLTGFSDEDFSIFIAHLINYCNQKIRIGQLKFIQDIFDLYRFLLKEGKILNGGYISYTDFNNVVELGVKLGEKDWIIQFIKDYESLIAPKQLKQDSLHIAKAIIAFEAKDYDQVFFLLNTVKALDLDHAQRIRWLLLCTHFEKHPNSTQFKNYCKAYKIYFERNETLHPATITGSLNLLNFVKKMTQAFNEKILREEIINTTLLVYRVWLLKKVAPTF